MKSCELLYQPAGQEQGNIMLLATRSLWGRRLKHTRFAHNSTIASKETHCSGGGWGANLWPI